MQEDEDFFADFEFTKSERKRYNLMPAKDEDGTETGEKKDDQPEMLDPNHPLLEKFQRVLKEHLTKQIERLRDDVGELELGVKKKDRERETLGTEAYETQQFVTKQQADIDVSQNELQTLAAASREIEIELKETLEVLKENRNNLVQAEVNEIKMRNEVESSSLLLKQMAKWEQDIESDLMVNQRIADKTRKDKIKLANEKKQQDMLIYKLTKEVWRLESELETMAMQLRVKEEEREKYAEAIMLTNIDIEAGEAEHRCLVHGWQSIIHTISKRDKHYNDLMSDIKKLDEKLLSVTTEISQVKKWCNREHLKNETLTVFKERIQQDKKNGSRTLNIEIEKRNKYDKCIMQYDSVVERLEEDIANVKMEMASVNSQREAQGGDYNKLLAEKSSLEESIFQSFQDKLTANQTSSRLLKVARSIKENNRELKIQLTKLENSNSKAIKEGHFQQLENQRLKRIYFDFQKQISMEDATLSKCIADHKRCTDEQVKNFRIHQNLMRKLQKIQEEISMDQSPQEIKIRTLEGTIADMQEKNKEMQTFWLREQTIVVDLTEKRQAQIKDLNLLKKQTTIMDQKNLKINDQIESYSNQEAEINRKINSLQNKMFALTDSLDTKRDRKESLDGQNNFTQVELVLKLEEAEFESLKLKAEISDFEEDKVALSNELVEKNREALCWEKKIQMAAEAKKNITADQSGEGEIGKMKAEIHRMNVRFSQLKKAQDKLITDLDHCVSRRDSIVTLAEAKIQMVKGGFQKIRVNFSKKIDDMKNKLRQIDYDEENINRKIEMKQYEIDNLEEEIALATVDCRNLQAQCDETGNDIEKKKIDKQLNLDVLLFKQRKLKIYSELSRGRLPFTVHKSPSTAHVAYEREKDMNTRLRVIVENLMTDFPQHYNSLIKMHNSLVLPSINL